MDTPIFGVRLNFPRAVTFYAISRLTTVRLPQALHAGRLALSIAINYLIISVVIYA